MRPRLILAALLASLLAFDVASAKPAPAGELHTFFGEVKAIDLAAKTLTLKSSGKSFVFRITKDTKISAFRGYIRLEQVRPGQAARVVMRVGEGGIGIALSIRFDQDVGVASILALYSVKTTAGRTVSGMAFEDYVVERPPADAWSGGVRYEAQRPSMFQLFIRPDGTVADAKPIGGLGYPQLNERAVKWCKRWRFRPNSVTEARMPVGYFQVR
jgi:hypothetical protein